MGIQLGSAYGKVSLDVSGLLSSITKGKAGLQTLVTVGQQVGSSLKSIGNTLTVGVTLPLIAAGGAAIKYASDLEETRNKIQVIFGDMSADILKWSQTSATALGQNKTQALDAAANFAIFGKAAGLANQDLVTFAESNVQLASDLASFFNTSPEEAILAIGAAYRGESEPIRKYGVLLNDAALRQKALEMHLISSLGPLTQQQRILAANALILEQTKDAQGDFARTSDGLANSSRILNAQFKDMLATLGQNLLPIALQVVQALNSMLEKFNQMSPVQQKMVLGFLGFLAILGPLLTGLGTLITTISTVAEFVGLLSTAGISLTGIGTALTATVVPAVAAVGAALAPILLILLAVTAAVVLFGVMWKTNFFWIRDNTRIVVNTIKLLWQALTAFLRGDTASAGAYLKEAWDDITKTIMGRLKQLFDWMGPGARSAIMAFINLIGQLRTYVVNAFTKTDWSQVGKYILMGIANGMLGGLPTLLSVAVQVATATLDQIKHALGIASDSKEGIKIGYFLGHGITAGVPMGWDPDTIARTISKPVTSMGNSQQQINLNFASGLTIQEVRGMIAQNNDALLTQLNRAMQVGG